MSAAPFKDSPTVSHNTSPKTDLLPSEVHTRLTQLHHQGKKIVFVSGVFDVLHQEHRYFLEKAKAAGDALIVALESDLRVRQIKGEGRPIHPQHVRQQQIEQLSLADIVFILPEDFSDSTQHRRLIQEIRPDVLAVSSHTAHLDKKRAIMEAVGGTLAIVHQHNPAISSSQLLAQTQKK